MLLHLYMFLVLFLLSALPFSCLYVFILFFNTLDAFCLLMKEKKKVVYLDGKGGGRMWEFGEGKNRIYFMKKVFSIKF